MIKAKDIERDEPIDLMVIAADVVSEMALKELELIPLLKNNFYDIKPAIYRWKFKWTTKGLSY
mgnify:CR=1 FL=1